MLPPPLESPAVVLSVRSNPDYDHSLCVEGNSDNQTVLPSPKAKHSVALCREADPSAKPLPDFRGRLPLSRLSLCQPGGRRPLCVCVLLHEPVELAETDDLHVRLSRGGSCGRWQLDVTTRGQYNRFPWWVQVLFSQRVKRLSVLDRGSERRPLRRSLWVPEAARCEDPELTAAPTVNVCCC